MMILLKEEWLQMAASSMHSITKEDATSPTVALKSVLLMATIDAAEGRDVATIDILNAFIQTRLDDDSDKVIMWLHRKLAELMVEVAPEILQVCEC